MLKAKNIYPAFATHNALTVATILEWAGGSRDFEFQRLHGMGEELYAELRKLEEGIGERVTPVRIYAPCVASWSRTCLWTQPSYWTRRPSCAST